MRAFSIAPAGLRGALSCREAALDNGTAASAFRETADFEPRFLIMEEIEIWRTAAQMLKQHGDTAELACAARLDDMIDRGDVVGEANWKRVLSALVELQRTCPVPGETIH
jgi:hypothetical protein